MYLPYYDIYSYPVVTPVRGRTLLLMGFAQDGPVNIPVPCANLTVAERIFGKEGTLYKAFKRAYEVDQNLTIYLMRVTGEHATAVLYGTNGQPGGETKEVIKLRTISGGNKYNAVQAIIVDVPIQENKTNTVLLFNFPDEVGLEPRGYVLSDYANCNELVDAINQDTRAGLNCVLATAKEKQFPAKTIASRNSSVVFSGGEDGDYVDKNELYLALEYSYSLLEGYYIDYVCPVDARFDDVHPAAFYGSAIYGTSIYQADRDYLSLQDSENGNRLVSFQGQLIRFCKRQEGLGCMTHGILGMNIIKDPTDLAKHPYSYIVRLLETSGFKNRYDLAEFRAGEWYDKGYYISITAGEMYYDEETDNEYYENIAVTYAAMLASLSPYGTTTNQKIPTANRLRYQFQAEELIELANLGVVAPRESVRHGIVIANGVTASLPTTEMHSIANVRQVQIALSFLNEVLDTYIGLPILDLIQSSTLQDAIENVLNSLKEDGILIDYNYNLEYDENKGTGLISVDLQGKLMVEFVSASSLLTFSG